MTLHSVDQAAAAAGHRPMSLLLQALKQIELKPPGDAESRSTIVAEDPACEAETTFTAERATSVALEVPDAIDASASIAAAPLIVQTTSLPSEVSIDVVRQYGDAETESELVLAEPFELSLIEVAAPQSAATSASIKPRRGDRRLGEQVLGLLPHDSRAAIAIVSLDGAPTEPLAYEVCSGLAALDAGEVLAITVGQVAASAVPPSCDFAEVALGRAAWQDAIIQPSHGQFSVLPQGDMQALASLSRRRLLTVWQELGERFAYIVLEFSDAELDRAGPVLATCDAALVALRLHETKRIDVERLSARIRSSGCHLHGCLVR